MKNIIFFTCDCRSFSKHYFYYWLVVIKLGFVLATLSFCDIAEILFQKAFGFILGHRFAQDVTENIFSEIRNKEGKMPSALKALRAVRNISVAQFLSDV